MDPKTAKLSDYEKRKEEFAKVRALIMKLINTYPGMTQEQIKTRFYNTYDFMPCIDNRLRELREMKWVESRIGGDGYLHWHPVPINIDTTRSDIIS